jgi:CDP-glycerol glycerophosphotransferase (TagB/SpsB family)/glycosyltransferase involved in cell wall biosynthesis
MPAFRDIIQVGQRTRKLKRVIKEETENIMGNTKEYQFKVSVVTAVYNVEEYLEEMIESILIQTIGIENIQLVLVDDGSKDTSGEICDRYAMQYPENIVVVHKENGGVSSARNVGLDHAKGECINFTDADDKLQDNALEMMYDYLKENEEWIDLVAIRTKFFGVKSQKHPLDYKFKKTKLVDLRKEYTYIQLFINATLIKRECFNTRRFDTELSYAEDAKVTIDILIEKMRYGIKCGTNYMYRKRAASDSALDIGRTKPAYYVPYMERFILCNLENAAKKKGYIPYFVQYSCMYDLQWRINRNPFVEPDVLTLNEAETYKALTLKALQYIDNKIIQEQKNLDDNYKSAILALKEDNRRNRELVYLPNNLTFSMGNLLTVNAGSYGRSSYEFIDISHTQIVIEGYVKCYPELDDIEILLRSTDKSSTIFEYKAEIFEREDVCSFCMDEKIIQGRGFRFVIDRNEMPDELNLRLCQRYHGHIVLCNSITFGRFFPLTKQLKNSYLYEDGILLTYSGNSLCFSGVETSYVIKAHEKKLQKELQQKKSKKIKRARIARKIYFLLKPLKRKEIWLISDRLTKADDNGEAFFNYMKESRKTKNVNAYFVLDKESSDYQRIKKIGKVVPYHSTKHKILSLLCDKLISSHADEYVINRFFGEEYIYRDILHKRKYVFLQHGVTKDDLSRWLARANKNISIFVTTTRREYQSILDCAYHYDERQVKCTGLPRYDYLYDNSKDKKIITFMPTWRNYLVGNLNVQTNSRILKEGFENSNYCQMYQQVFSDNRLYEAAEKYHYSIQLMMHPAMPQEYVEYFNCSDKVRVLDTNIRYKELFADSKLIVTDYSSAVFDFAYLRKPVVYYQQDVEEFFSGKHVYDKGYFEYEKDGFGEVEYTADALVDRLIEYMENDCKLKDLYRDRIEKTFPYNDRDNCKRVYEEIVKL